MSDGGVVCVPSAEWPPDLSVVRSAAAVVVFSGASPGQEAITRLADAVDGDLVATASPVQLDGSEAVVLTRLLGPPSPVVPYPSHVLVCLSAQSLELLAPRIDEHEWGPWIAAFATLALAHGFRHVLADGVATDNRMGDGPFASDPLGIADMAGAANGAVAQYRHWAELAVRPPVVFVDGSCLGEDASTGTHALVLNLALEIARRRPEATVHLVAPRHAHDRARQTVGGEPNVWIRSKADVGGELADVVCRPYQTVHPGELRWCRDHARVLVMFQLDLIAFDNPTYFPSVDIFFGVRNVIRAGLRCADGVAFISAFGRDNVLAAVSGLEPGRLAVVPCGTDHVASVAGVRPSELDPEIGRFVLCLSGSFRHKNRPFAVSVFVELSRTGFDGHLLLVGSEPYYGSSIGEVRHLLDEADPVLSGRVHLLGVVTESEKWWLLEHAVTVLYPSVVEGFGLVPFEAARAGTPTLAYAGTAQRELMGDGVELATNWDPAAWAHIVHRWSADAAASARQVNAIREKSEQLTWAAAAEKWWRLADDVLAMPRRVPSVGEAEGSSSVRFPVLRWRRPYGADAVIFARRARAYLRRSVAQRVRRW